MTDSSCVLDFSFDADVIRHSLSAVRHVGPHLWLGCDETATLERLTWHGDRASDHQHFKIGDFLELPSADDEEVDVEGIAHAGYYLWFVGSHSLKRKTVKPDNTAAANWQRLKQVEREDNRYTLGRIPLVDGQLFKTCPHPERPDVILTAAQLKRQKKGNELTARLEDDEHLGDFLKADLPGKDNGLDIEGIVVVGDRLFVGLRGPVLRGWAVLLELQVKAEETGVLRLQKLDDSKARCRKCFLDLGGLGIRDLCVWQDKLLILAGPTMTLDADIRIFTLPLVDLCVAKPLLKPSVLMDVPSGKGCDRAEGITLIDPDQSAFLVVYDAPAPERLQGDNAVLADLVQF